MLRSRQVAHSVARPTEGHFCDETTVYKIANPKKRSRFSPKCLLQMFQAVHLDFGQPETAGAVQREDLHPRLKNSRTPIGIDLVCPLSRYASGKYPGNDQIRFHARD